MSIENSRCALIIIEVAGRFGHTLELVGGPIVGPIFTRYTFIQARPSSLSKLVLIGDNLAFELGVDQVIITAPAINTAFISIDVLNKASVHAQMERENNVTHNNMSIENSLEKIASTLNLILEELRGNNGVPEVKIESGAVDDPIYDEVVEFVVNSGRASTATLQRKFQIGHGRASKLIDLLEEAKVISPSNGANPRKVLLSLKQYQKQKKAKGITLKF